jgi:hypothetical protein
MNAVSGGLIRAAPVHKVARSACWSAAGDGGGLGFGGSGTGRGLVTTDGWSGLC